MKNLFLLVSFLYVAFSANSQNIIDKNFSQVADREDATTVFVSGKMFGFAKHIEISTDDEDFNDLKEFVTSIQSFNLVAVEDHESARSEYKNGIKKIKPYYDELIRVNDKEGNFSLYIDEDNGIVNELVGIGSGEKEFVVFSLMGKMNLNKIGDIISEIESDAGGLKSLKSVNTYDVGEVKVYPNPATADSDLTLELTEQLLDGTITVFDMNGKKVKTAQAKNLDSTINTDGLTGGHYVVQIEKDNVVIKKKVLIVE